MSRLTISFSVAITLAVIFHIGEVKSVASEAEAPAEVSETVTPLGRSHYEIEENVLKAISSHQLQDRIRPNGTTHVKVNMYVRDAEMKTGGIKVTTDPYYPWTLELTFRQTWNDPRLTYSVSPNANFDGYVPLNNLRGIWKPDLFFPSAEKGFIHDMITPNELVWVYPNGDVLYSVRLSLSLSCRQTSVPLRFGHGIGKPVACPLRIASYGYTSEQLSLEWDEKDPIQMPKTVTTESLGYCSLDQVLANATTRSKTRTGSFDSITAEFQFLC